MPSEPLNLSALHIGDLRKVLAEFCRVHRRPHWWENATSPAGPFGRLISELLLLRMCRTDTDPSRDKEITLLRQLFQPSHEPDMPRFYEFLAGRAGARSVFWKDGPRLLRRCLDGGQQTVDAESTLLIDRIVRFFLPHGPTLRSRQSRAARGFFDPLFKDCAAVQTPAEVDAELGCLAYYLRDDADPPCSVLIVRASGFRRFLQRDDGEGMSPSGIRTIELLRAGASVVYAYPAGATDSPAAQSASSFLRYADEQLRDAPAARERLSVETVDTTAVAPDACTLHGGSFLTPALRYAYLNANPRAAGNGASNRAPTAPPVRTLIVTHRSERGPSAYEPDRREIEAFERWARTFVLPVPSSRGCVPVPADTAPHAHTLTMSNSHIQHGAGQSGDIPKRGSKNPLKGKPAGRKGPEPKKRGSSLLRPK